MSSPSYRVRRATVDDIGALRDLWTSMHLPADELEKRLTEFQVAEDAEGKVVGTLGFAILQRHGLLHSESFTDFSLADPVRPLFWTRIQSLVLNHGVARIWTRENAPFWSRNGFLPANEQTLQKLPASWAQAGESWLSLQLKDEEAIVSIEKEIAMLMQAEKAQTARAIEQAKVLKTVVTVIGLLFAIAVLGAAAYVFLSRGSFHIPAP